LSGGRNIRVFFAVSEGIMVLHGFIKKSQVPPGEGAEIGRTPKEGL
jgi:phage-related protein